MQVFMDTLPCLILSSLIWRCVCNTNSIMALASSVFSWSSWRSWRDMSSLSSNDSSTASISCSHLSTWYNRCVWIKMHWRRSFQKNKCCHFKEREKSVANLLPVVRRRIVVQMVNWNEGVVVLVSWFWQWSWWTTISWQHGKVVEKQRKGRKQQAKQMGNFICFKAGSKACYPIQGLPTTCVHQASNAHECIQTLPSTLLSSVYKWSLYNTFFPDFLKVYSHHCLQLSSSH